MIDSTVFKALGRAEEMTKVLLNSLQDAIVPSSITSCVEELNAHLIKYPACKAVVWQVRNIHTPSPDVQLCATL